MNQSQLKTARIATLQIIQNNIRKMTRIKIAEKNKPIMAPSLEAEIESALAQFVQKAKWREWGMDGFRKQGNMLLLYGPPGTGKTTIARYMSKRVGKGMETLNMKDVGGREPGHTERMTHQFFHDCKLAGNKTVFMDECEAIMWDRGHANSDSMWMVGVIDEILMQTVEYPGLIVAATNRDDIVDNAFKDRCFATLQIGHPDTPERIRLWKQKIPERYPIQPSQIQFERLAEYPLTGRQIENVIVREASLAIVEKRSPRFFGLIDVCKKLIK